MRSLRTLAAWLVTPRVEPAPAPAPPGPLADPIGPNDAITHEFEAIPEFPGDPWDDFDRTEPGGKA